MCIFNNSSSLALPTDSKGRYCNLIYMYNHLDLLELKITSSYDLIFILFTHMLFSNYQVLLRKNKSGNWWKHLCCPHKECELIDLLNCHRLRFYNLKTYHNEQVNISLIKKKPFSINIIIVQSPVYKMQQA